MDARTSFLMAHDLGAGIDPIDRDHAEMVQLARELGRMHAADDLSGLRVLMDELLAAAESHWQREEAMLRRYGYPGLDDHIHSHDQARTLLQELTRGRGGHEAAYRAEHSLVRQLIDDNRWKWWFLDAGLRPEVA